MNFRNRLIACFLCAFLLLPVYSNVFAQEVSVESSPVPSQETTNDYAPGEIIVKYQPATNMLSGDENEPGIRVSGRRKIEVVETLEKDETGRTQVWKVDDENVENFAQELAQMPEVAYAEPNYKIQLDNVSYDTEFGEQWGLSNSEGYDINIQDVWQSVYGGEPKYMKDITVAVLDTGADISHPDLRHQIFINTAEQGGESEIDDDGNGFIDDVTGWDFIDNTNTVYDNKLDSLGLDEDRHGTHVAGIIAAELNGKGIQGVAYDFVKILPIKFIAGSDGGYTSDAIKGIQYAEKMGASIVNCSWGSKGTSTALKETMRESNMLFVCSAGNEGEVIDSFSPSCFGKDLPNVVTVSATDQYGNCASFSNYGSDTIGAPGVSIYSTLPGEAYGYLNGTSMAAPFVTGVAALIRFSNKRLAADEVKDSLFDGYQGSAQSNQYFCKLDAHKAFTNKVPTSDNEMKLKGIRQYGGETIAIGNKIYSIGGYNQDGYISDVKKYDPKIQEWQAIYTPEQDEFYPPFHERVFASYFENGKNIYAVGGRNASEEFSDTRLFDSYLDTFDYDHNAIYDEPISAAATVVGENGLFYICGGITNGTYLDTVRWEVLNSAIGNLSIKMPEKRGYGCAQYLDGCIYVFGGSNENGCLDTTYKYDVKTRTWTECAKTNGYHNNGKSIARNGKIYLFGGSTQYTADGHDNVMEASDGSSYDMLSSMVEEYDPATDTWTRLPDMDLARSGFSVLDYYGNVIITGGWNGTYVEEAEYYWGLDEPEQVRGEYADNTDQFTIIWDTVEDATGYEVEVNGTIHQVKTTYLENVNWETDGQFRVRAVKDNKKGIWSGYHALQQRGASIETAIPLPLNQAVSGVLTSDEQKQWYTLETGSLSDVNITLSNLPQNSQYCFQVLDTYGKIVAEGTPSLGEVKLSNYVLEDDIYYIGVYAVDKCDPGTTYQLTVSTDLVERGPGRLSNNSVSIVNASVRENVYQLESENLVPDGPSIELEPIETELGINNSYLAVHKTGRITDSKRAADFVTPEVEEGWLVTAVVIPPEGNIYNVFPTDLGQSNPKVACSTMENYNNAKQISSSTFIAPVTKKYNIRVNGFYNDYDNNKDFEIFVYITKDPDQYESNQWILDALVKKSLQMGGRGKLAEVINASFETNADIDTYPIDAAPGDKITVNIDLLDGGQSSNYNIGFYSNFSKSPDKPNADGSGVDFYVNYDRSDLMNTKTVKSGEHSCFANWVVPANASNQCYIAVQRKNKDYRKGEKQRYNMTVTKVSAQEMQDDPYESKNGYQNDCIVYGGFGKPGKFVNGVGNGTIDNQLDVDWFEYTAEKTGNVTFTLNGMADLATLASNEVRPASGKTASMFVKQGETYHVCAYVKDGGYQALMNNPGYTITVNNNGFDDVTSLQFQDGEIKLSGVSGYSDKTYQFNVPSNGNYTLYAGSTGVFTYTVFDGYNHALGSFSTSPLQPEATKNIQLWSNVDYKLVIHSEDPSGNYHMNIAKGIQLTDGKGELELEFQAGNPQTIAINQMIPANKMVVVSLQDPEGQEDIFESFDAFQLNYMNATKSHNSGQSDIPLIGGWSSDSRMSYFSVKDDEYLKIVIKPNVTTKATVIAYSVDTIQGDRGFTALDSLEQNTNTSKNYVISNTPENMDLSGSRTLSNDQENAIVSTAKMIDGSSGEMYSGIVPTVRSQITEQLTEKLILNSPNDTEDIWDIIDKIDAGEQLSAVEESKYHVYLKEQNIQLTMEQRGSANIEQLGEYGYYLMKAKVNGNANVYWEHVNKISALGKFGVMLYNNGALPVTVSLNRRSFHSDAENAGTSNPHAMNHVWVDYFNHTMLPDQSDLPFENGVTIAPGEGKWICLYDVPGGGGYNTFNGVVNVSIKNSNGSLYTEEDVYCYTFWMSDYVNENGQNMPDLVKANMNTMDLKRANHEEKRTEKHISGSGKGAVLYSSHNRIIDVTSKKYAFLLTGFDMPHINEGELIEAYHDGDTYDKTHPYGYRIPNILNYSVIYRFDFKGFHSIPGKNIKLKLKYNRATNPNAVKPQNGGGIYVTAYSDQFGCFSALVGDPSQGFEEEVIPPWNINPDQPFNLYLVASGMSSMPLEVEVVSE